MGSCYSTKSNQMPHTTPSNQSSPASKRSSAHTQATNTSRSKNATSVKAVGTGGSSAAFGFRKPYGGRYGSAKQNGEAGGSGKDSTAKGDFVKASVNKGCSTQATNGRPSPARARFGFKRPTTAVSAKVGDSSRDRSNESMRSAASIASGDARKPATEDKPVKTDYVRKTSTFKPSSARPIRMIDDSESSLPDCRRETFVNPSGACEVRMDNASKSSSEDTLCDQANNEDLLNANIPERTTSDKNTNIRVDNQSCENPADNLTCHSLNIRNHSKSNVTSKQTAKSKISGTTGLKVPTKLAVPFAKSKPGLSGDIVSLAEKRGKVQGRGKENVSVASQKQASGVLTSRSSSAQKGNFLKKTFSKQKSPPVNSSHANNSDISPKSKKSSAICIEDVGISDSFQDSHEKQTAPEAIEKAVSECVQPESAAETTKENTSPGVGFEVSQAHFLQHGHGENTLQRMSKVRASVPPSVKDQLEHSVLPAGKAPLAHVDPVETSSLGSIASDDLMLETEIDLGDYDEDMTTDTPSQGSYKGGGVMRHRSRSGSGPFRSRSFEKNKGHTGADKQAQHTYVSGQVRSGFKTGGHVINSAGQGHNDVNVDDRVFESPAQGQRDVQTTESSRKTETFHLRRSGAWNEAENESEAVGELHQLMGLHNGPVSRRYPRLDKANRPASFPGFHRQVPDPSPDNVTSGPVLRPPRTSSFGDDEKITIDATTYRQMTQEFTVFKTMLLKLKRVIQEDELTSPLTAAPWKNGLAFNTSQPNSPLKNENKFAMLDLKQDACSQNYVESVAKENEELRHQLQMMRHQIEEQERTIKLLQQQMTKYECGHFDGEGKGFAHMATQTDQPSGTSIGKKTATHRFQKTDRPSSKCMASGEKTSRHSATSATIDTKTTSSPAKSTTQVRKAFCENRSHSAGRYRPEISLLKMSSEVTNEQQECSHVARTSGHLTTQNDDAQHEQNKDQQTAHETDVLHGPHFDGNIPSPVSVCEKGVSETFHNECLNGMNTSSCFENVSVELDALADKLHSVKLNSSSDSPVAVVAGKVGHSDVTVTEVYQRVPEVDQVNEREGEGSGSVKMFTVQPVPNSDQFLNTVSEQTPRPLTSHFVNEGHASRIPGTGAKHVILLTKKPASVGKSVHDTGNIKHSSQRDLTVSGDGIQNPVPSPDLGTEKTKTENINIVSGNKSKLPAFSKIAMFAKASRLPSFRSSKK